MLITVLIVILILMLVGAFPHWGYNQGWAAGAGPWGYGPFGVILIILLILILFRGGGPYW